jgi:Tfp pilus assembly protein FimT
MQQIRRMQLNNDAQEVVQLAIETRSEAIFRKQNRQIIFSSNTSQGISQPDHLRNRLSQIFAIIGILF